MKVDMKPILFVALCLLAFDVSSQMIGGEMIKGLRQRESAISEEKILKMSPLRKNEIIFGKEFTEQGVGNMLLPKIINPDGQAKKSQFPFMVAIGGVGVDNKFKPFCGGSVIHPRYVLTAAHCAVEVQEKLTQVLWGQENLTVTDSARVSTVVSVFSHEAYLNLTGTRYDNDLALLYVDPPIKSPPVLLANSGPREPGEELVVMGWGANSVPQYKDGEIIASFPDRLFYATLKTTIASDCKARYMGLDQPAPVTENMFCAAADQKDTCQGDSGGPIAFKDEAGRWRQVGVVSFGVSCASPLFPGVYTRLPRYVNWITQRVFENFAQSKP